jgi:hypothetical protein
MRTHLFVLALSLLGCGSKDTTDAPAPAAAPAKAEKPHHHEDRKDPQAGASKLALAITAGADKSTWTEAQFAAVPKIDGKATDGEARDTWNLRDLAHANLGPTARVTAVIGESRIEIKDTEWADAARIPILHTTRRGTLKFRWADAAGKWGETAVKEVTGLEIQR